MYVAHTYLLHVFSRCPRAPSLNLGIKPQYLLGIKLQDDSCKIRTDRVKDEMNLGVID